MNNFAKNKHSYELESFYCKILGNNKNILYICKSCNQKKNSYESNTCKQLLKMEKVGSTFYSKYQTEVRDQEVKNLGTE